MGLGVRLSRKVGGMCWWESVVGRKSRRIGWEIGRARSHGVRIDTQANDGGPHVAPWLTRYAAGHDSHCRRPGLPITARSGPAAWAFDCHDRRKWERQVNCVSLAAPTGGHQSEPCCRFACARGRVVLHVLGGSRDYCAECSARNACSGGARKAQLCKFEAGLWGRHVWVQHRSWVSAATASTNDVWIGSARQAGVSLAGATVPEGLGAGGSEKQFCVARDDSG